MAQYVFTMNRVGKIVPPKRQILKDISLSFFPGAKIGVLGLNGAGKSSLLRIMAGEDKEYDGDATPMPDLRIGFLPQEPRLDPESSVRRAVEQGMGLTVYLGVDAGHDAQQRGLAGAVQAQHADLGAGEERQRDVLEDHALGRNDLAHAIHRVDVLSHWELPRKNAGKPVIMAGAGDRFLLAGSPRRPGTTTAPRARKKTGAMAPVRGSCLSSISSLSAPGLLLPVRSPAARASAPCRHRNAP